MAIGEAPCGHAKITQQRNLGYHIKHSLSSFFLQEFPHFLSVRRETGHAALAGGRVAGPQVHDARVAALCLLHGVQELWTADRDFGRFPGLKVRNPLFR
jgi:predicted nucleic acid-binding protein